MTCTAVEASGVGSTGRRGGLGWIHLRYPIVEPNEVRLRSSSAVGLRLPLPTARGGVGRHGTSHGAPSLIGGSSLCNRRGTLKVARGTSMATLAALTPASQSWCCPWSRLSPLEEGVRRCFRARTARLQGGCTMLATGVWATTVECARLWRRQLPRSVGSCDIAPSGQCTPSPSVGLPGPHLR